MNVSLCVAGLLLVAACVAGPVLAADAPTGGSLPAPGVRQGDRLELGGRTVSVLALDTLPCVSNKLTERLQFDKHGDPVLEKLRRDNRLDDVIAPGASEFEKQLLLMEWAFKQIQYGDPVELGKVRDPLKLLELSRKGRVLYCECFASLYIAAAASMGWTARAVDIPTHSFTEIWSSQYRKWIMMDPTGHFYAEKDGVPLNVYEIRKEWFENGGKGGLVFRRGRERYVGGGRGFAPYTVLYYVFKRDWLGNRPADGAMTTKDKWSGSRDARYPLVENPQTDPYVPVNQASLTVAPDGRSLKVSVRTWTPNFKTFRARRDGGEWADSKETFAWELHAGSNLLEVQSVNLFDAGGPVSTVEVWVSDKPSREIVLPACSFAAEGGGQVGSRSRDGSVSPAYVNEWNTKGHWLEWTFPSPAEGEYDVTFLYATLFHPARQLTLNGEAAKGLESFTVGPTRRWENFSLNRLPARVKVRAGKNTLRLASLDDVNLMLSEVRLTAPGRADIVIAGTSFSGEGGGSAKRMVSPREGFFRFWDGKAHWLEWTLENVEAGTYVAFMQYGAMYDAPREMRVNGQVVGGLENFSLPVTGNWQTWGEHRLPSLVTLEKGRNVIRMANNTTNGVNMVGLRLVAPAGRELYVPAIRFTGEGGGKVMVVSPSRHRSITAWDGKGHWLEWNIAKAAEGDYDVVLHLAADRASSRELRLNGEPVKGLDPFPVAATGGWQTWQDVKLPVRVRLKAGDNVLRLTSTEGRSMNLDEIRLVPAEK